MEGHETEVNEEALLVEKHTPIIYEVNPNDVQISTAPITKLDTRNKKLLHLRSILEKDPKAADIKWSLFVAACQSYRFDSVLKPFPPAFLKEGVKDIDSLLRVAEDTPPLALLLQQLHDPALCQVHDHVIDLLYWVIVSMREPYLKTVENECFDSVLSRVPCVAAIPKPNYIFQVVSSVKAAKEVKWKAMARNNHTLYAYHGTKLENFHSIIHYGLQQHMSKNDLFGKGIYLTSELSVSFPYSPTGYAWGGSKCGSELSCIALCELIDHKDYVKCQNSADDVKNNRAKVPNSIGGEVPNKYYVVTNNEMVRVRYLLVYSKSQNKASLRPSLLGWFVRHKLLTFFIGYGILLSVIGVANSDQGAALYSMCMKKLASLYELYYSS